MNTQTLDGIVKQQAWSGSLWSRAESTREAS
jgi:hypothetical protein